LKEVIFIIGGCRSGKSRHALETAEGLAEDQKIFMATCIPHDEEMQQRVRRHQAERNRSWQTIETPVHLPRAIEENSRRAGVLLVDCLTLWISNLLMESDDGTNVQEQIQGLKNAIQSAGCPVVLVSNEVGGGIVPENRLARLFRDLVGSANQAVAETANRVVWMVAGIPVRIKG